MLFLLSSHDIFPSTAHSQCPEMWNVNRNHSSVNFGFNWFVDNYVAHITVQIFIVTGFPKLDTVHKSRKLQPYVIEFYVYVNV